MNRNVKIVLGLVFGIASWGLVQFVTACPFCSSISQQTFNEEIDSMDVVVLASILESADPNDPNALPKATFRIKKVVKGQDWAKVDTEVETNYYGDGKKDRTYLLMGTDAPNLMWTAPLPLTVRAKDYILKLPSLAKDATRLEFFQEHLEDEDEMLARDAYDEFAKAPYENVIALKDKMHRDRIIDWLNDSEIPATRRRLYFTMLGICGQSDDTVFLEEMMRSDDRKKKAGLDALIACYLLLKGEAGLDVVDELFLQNKKAEYADTYSAIMAIRFHLNEAKKLSRSRLIVSLRHILDRPNLADLVIPDLASCEDWEVMDRLVELFKSADEKSSWVRVPVINFLRSCPLPKAEEYIEELNGVDPEAVKRAKTFFPFNEKAKKDDSKDEPKANEASSNSNRSDASLTAVQPAPIPDVSTVEVTATSSDLNATNSSDDAVTNHFVTSGTTNSQPVEKSREERTSKLNISTILSVPLAIGAILFVSMRQLLGVPFFHPYSN